MRVNTGSEALVTLAVLSSVSQLSTLLHPDHWQVLGKCPTSSPYEIAVDYVYTVGSLLAPWHTPTILIALGNRLRDAFRKPETGCAARAL